MKRRPSRAVQIFSLSALDLFASAMGAFIVLSIILMPTYKKTQELEIKNESLREEISRAKAEEKAALEEIETTAKALQETTDEQEATRSAAEDLEKETEELRDFKTRKISYPSFAMRTCDASILILIDASLKMGTQKARLAETLDRIIDELGPVHKLGLVAFNGVGAAGDLTSWPTPLDLTVANAESRTSAKEFVRNLRFAEGRPVYSALSAALRTKAQTIIVIAAGEPPPDFNQGLYPPDVLQKVREANADDETSKRIFSIALAGATVPKIGFVLFYQTLAAQNHGQFQLLAGG